MAGSVEPSLRVYVGMGAMASTLVTLSGAGRVVGIAVRPSVFLHLGLEQVPPATDELVACELLQRLERRVVAVVVHLDDLEGPATPQDVATHQLGVETVGELGVAGLAELLDRLAEGQVGGAGEPVEGVEVAADVLH